MEANKETKKNVLQIPDTYPNEFKAVDINTGHEYCLIGMNKTYKENNKKKWYIGYQFPKGGSPVAFLKSLLKLSRSTILLKLSSK